MLRHCTKCF